METFRIATKSRVVIADGLPVSAPSIQLHEGIVSKGDKPPKDLLPGESSTVAYPLVQGRLVCRVTRTVEGVVPEAVDKTPIEFVEPDSLPKKEKRNPVADALDAHYAKKSKLPVMSVEEADKMIEDAKLRRLETASTAAKAAIEDVKVRRGKGRKSSS